MTGLVGGLRKIQIGLLGVVQEGHQLVVLAMLDRVVFVRVALGAADSQAQPRGAGGGHPVGHRMETELQRIDAALLIEHRVAVESRGDELVSRRIRKQVSRQLLHGEPVERHVGVEGADHPVAPGPDAPGAVFFVAVGVGVPGEVHPAPGPAFAVAGRGQQSVHPALIAGIAGVLQELLDFGRRGGQSDQIERHAPGQGVGIGLP